MLHRKTKTTGPQNTIARITKSIHPRVVEGRKGRKEGTWHREKKYSNQSRHRGWQLLEKSCRKTCGLFRLTGVKNPHTGVRKIVPYVHQRQKPQFLREKGICRGPLAEWVLPSLVGEVKRKELHSFLLILLIPSGWQGTQWPAAAFSLAGDGCGEGNFSAEVELLRADCR